MKTIITTVGTSLFENFEKDGDKNAIKEAYRNNLRIKDWEYSQWNNNDESIEEYRNQISDAIKEPSNNNFWNSPNTSAEIRSIIEICKQDTEGYEVHLLATDTVLSVLAAELICEWFNRSENKERPDNLKNCLFFKPEEPETFKEQGEELYVIKDLRVDNKATFEKGFMNLVEVLNKLIAQNKKDKKETILNITGGYKAIIPIITLLGQLYEVPLKYMYKENELQNGESPLLEVGNLPFGFDISYIENYVDFIVNPSKVNNNSIARKLFELGLVTSVTHPTELSIIGKLIKIKLESEDLPFQRTTMGYFVEYKFYEFYAKYPPTLKINNQDVIFDSVELGYKLSDNPNQDLEDADLWFEKDSCVIIGEIKPASIKAKALKNKIRKILGFVSENKVVCEFWIILYEYEGSEIDNNENWCYNVVSLEIQESFPTITFRIKKIKISKNAIDGSRNRLLYHEFMRSQIDYVIEVFKWSPQPI